MRGALLLALLAGCREQLVHNLSEQQANRLVTRLDDTKIDSQKKRQADGRWSVEVDRTQLPVAMREMQKMRLLREAGAAPVENSSVISSRDQQRFLFERALSGEIEQTVSSLNGVLEARVHLNLPQVDPLFGKVVPGAMGGGSVFIIAENHLAFNQQDIARLVAGAAGISADHVSVLIEVEPQHQGEGLSAIISQSKTVLIWEIARQSLLMLQAPISSAFMLTIGVSLILGGSWILRHLLLLTKSGGQ